MHIQRGETDFFSGEPLRALSTLVFSDNVDLQRSASLTFAEITERGTSIILVERETHRSENASAGAKGIWVDDLGSLGSLLQAWQRWQ